MLYQLKQLKQIKEKMELKFKKLNDDAHLPRYAKLGDAGLDLTTIQITKTETYIQCHTGLAVEIPEGYVGLIFPRSSITKTNLMLGNSIGVIDSGYRGEILIRFKHIKSESNNFIGYNIGEKVAQLIILPYPKIEPILVDELTDTDRGDKGFGSTTEKTLLKG